MNSDEFIDFVTKLMQPVLQALESSVRTTGRMVSSQLNGAKHDAELRYDQLQALVEARDQHEWFPAQP